MIKLKWLGWEDMDSFDDEILRKNLESEEGDEDDFQRYEYEVLREAFS